MYSMSTAYVELVERFLVSELSIDLGPDAITACSNLSEDQLSFISQQLHAVDAEQHAAMVQGRPASLLFHPEERAKCTHWEADEDIRPTSAMFTHPYIKLRPLDLEHLKRQLLLFSRVAIHAPFFQVGSSLAESRRGFSVFLRALIDLRSLIEDRSVVLLPRNGFYSNEIEGGAALVRRACEEDSTIGQWVSSHKVLLEDFTTDARPGDPFFDAGLRICSAITYGHTLAATHPFVGQLYKLLLGDSRRLDRGKIAVTQNVDMIEMPSLGGLSWGDVVAVRRDEDCLRRWRADLAMAISSVDPDLPAEVFVERFDSQVQAQLQRAAIDLERDLKQSSSMFRFRKGAASLIISAVAATARVALGGPVAVWDEVCKVAQSDGAKEAVRFIWESRESAARRALRTHYAVFSSSNE